MTMNLKRVATFILLVEHKSFSSVASILKISQPAVSNQIKSLEDTLGILLIDRDTSEPTEAGKLVYKHGKQLLRSWDELVNECKGFQDQMSGVLHLGASTIPGAYLVPPLIKEFRDRFPRVEVCLHVHESLEIIQALRNGQLTIGFIGDYPQDADIESISIAQDHLVLIGPSTSDNIEGYGDIMKAPFIFRGDLSGTWKAAKESFSKWSNGESIDQLHCVAKVHSTESALAMVEAGLGYSIVSNLAASIAAKQKRIKVIAQLPNHRDFYLSYLRAHSQHPLIKEFKQLLTEKKDR